MINIILDGYYSPAIDFKEHLIREMNKSELSKLEFKNSLLMAIGSIKNKIEENFYRMLPLNDGLDIFKQGLNLMHINSSYRGHINYKEVIGIEEVINSLIVAKKGDITVNQLALKMAWENKIVTRKEHGDDLYNKVTKWKNRQNRIANPDGTNLKLQNQINLFNSVIPLLDQKFQKTAMDEVSILESYLNKTTKT
jgi:hypothetical protein